MRQTEKGYLNPFSGSLCHIFHAVQRIAGKAKVWRGKAALSRGVALADLRGLSLIRPFA